MDIFDVFRIRASVPDFSRGYEEANLAISERGSIWGSKSLSPASRGAFFSWRWHITYRLSGGEPVIRERGYQHQVITRRANPAQPIGVSPRNLETQGQPVRATAHGVAGRVCGNGKMATAAADTLPGGGRSFRRYRCRRADQHLVLDDQTLRLLAGERGKSPARLFYENSKSLATLRT